MELLTVQETADLLRVSPVTVRRYIAAGALPARRVGRGVRVERVEAERFARPVMNSHSANGTAPSEHSAQLEPRPKRGRKPRYLTYDDPIWSLASIFGDHDGPHDVARNKYKYLAEEYGKGLSLDESE